MGHGAVFLNSDTQSLWFEEELAGGAAGFEVGVCLSCLVKRIDVLGAKLELAAGGPSEDFTGAPLELGAGGNVMPQGGTSDEQRSFAAELDEVEGRDCAAGAAEESQKAAGAKTVEAFIKGGLAYRVVDYVDSLPFCNFLDLSFEVLLGVENDIGGAGFTGELSLCWRGDGGDDTPPAPACTSAVSPALSGNVE
jgi:hypothetical protein